MRPDKVWFFSDLIEKNKRIFKIPVYQRNYDWSFAQCEKLYYDIIGASKRDHKHFIGTVVYIVSKDGSALSEALIIDGQQRITTIYLLLKALYDTAKGTFVRIEEEIKETMFNRNCDEEYKVKLKPIKTDNEQLLLLMNDQLEDMDKKSNIYKNYLRFRTLIDTSLKTATRLEEILQGVKLLELVEIVLDKTQGDEPQKIFESINSTGLELCLSDLIRNYLLMDAENQDELYNKYWLRLENNVSYANLGDFFFYYINARVSTTVSNKKAYEIFKTYCVESGKSNEEILCDLVKISRYYSTFKGERNIFDQEIIDYLMAYNTIKQNTVAPLLFRILEDYEDNHITKETLCKVLHLLLTYLIRVTACEINKSTNQIMKTIYDKVIHGNYKNYYENFVIYLNDLKSADKMPTDDEFRYALLYKPLYNKNICKYILSAIENSTNEQIKVSNLTIEHILPQKENAYKWRLELGDKYVDIYQKYLHTLGNLTITGNNSNLGVKSFAEKQEIISKFSKANILNKDVLSANIWDEEAILKRSNNLADKLIEIFPYEEIHNEDDGTNERIYSIDEIDFTNSKPEGFSFRGEYKNVSSWRGLLIEFLDMVYDSNPQLLRSLAEKNHMIENCKTIYLSLDGALLRFPKEIRDSGILFCTNLSANDIAKFITDLVYHLDMTPDGLQVNLQKYFSLNDESTWDNVCPSRLFYNFVEDLLKRDKLSMEEISSLKTKEYTRQLFNITNYPALADNVTDHMGDSDKIKYRTKPLKYKNANIYVSMQIYTRHKEPIIAWYKSHK